MINFCCNTLAFTSKIIGSGLPITLTFTNSLNAPRSFASKRTLTDTLFIPNPLGYKSKFVGSILSLDLSSVFSDIVPLT